MQPLFVRASRKGIVKPRKLVRQHCQWRSLELSNFMLHMKD